VYLWDDRGQRYLDFSGSAAVNFIGHGVQEIPDAMATQARHLEFVHSSQFTTPVAEEYAQELLDFAGENFHGGCVYFTSGGSEAIETALKLARQYQVEIGQSERYQVLSRSQSYHGSTLGALAVSGNKRRREIYLPMVREFAQIALPYCYRCAYDCEECPRHYAEELERAIELTNGQAAAFISEPISGATLGAAVPPDGYFQQVAEICRRHGVLFIADEVMTGMGRTGRNFAIEHWAVAPDILVTAKGLSSGYAPLGAVLVSKKVAEAISSGSGSFLQASDSTRDATPASELRKALSGLRELEPVGDVRGIGMLWGVEFVTDKPSKKPFAPALNFAGRVAQAAMRRGLLVYPMQGSVDGVSGDHLLIAPPAVITYEQIHCAVDQLGDSIQEAAGSRPRSA